jgi:diguanylate cyclase (GGDEF)-like protein
MFYRNLHFRMLQLESAVEDIEDSLKEVYLGNYDIAIEAPAFTLTQRITNARFNDTYGHLMGDKVLVRTSQILMENTRETDSVVRYGGEEIAIVLPETNAKQAMIVAENLRNLIENAKYTYKNETVRVTLSLGVSTHKENDTVRHIIERADKALYCSKQNGRNQVQMEG